MPRPRVRTALTIAMAVATLLRASPIAAAGDPAPALAQLSRLVMAFDEAVELAGTTAARAVDAVEGRASRAIPAEPSSLAAVFDWMEAEQAVIGDRATLALDATITRVAGQLSDDQRRVVVRVIDDHVSTVQRDLETAIAGRANAPSVKAGVLTQIEIAEHRATYERLRDVRALIARYEP